MKEPHTADSHGPEKPPLTAPSFWELLPFLGVHVNLRPIASLVSPCPYSGVSSLLSSVSGPFGVATLQIHREPPKKA